MIGRRPVMIVMPLLSMLLPLGAMYFDGPIWVMVAIFFVGWALNGIFPLFMATVPSESVSPAMARHGVRPLPWAAARSSAARAAQAIAGMLADMLWAAGAACG